MNKYLIVALIGVIAGFLSACTSGAGETESVESRTLKTDTFDINHFNIIIAPDLSNRIDPSIYPKPVNDEEIVNVILSNIWPKILKYRRSENQKDKYSVSFINKGLTNLYDVDTDKLQIDFSTFDNQRERIDFIKDRSENTLKLARKVFIKEYNRINDIAVAKPKGADLYNYFKTLDGYTIKNKVEHFKSASSSAVYRNKFRNILILITDGYIEAGIYKNRGCPEGNKCYYLSGNRIKEFRQEFKRSGMKDLTRFYEEGKYGIIPVDNKNIENLEVLVLEMYDRSLDTAGAATTYPTDKEILDLFWNDWLKKSGVKKFELRQVASTKQELEQVIFSFLGVN
jgi:hypothetical protein